MAWLSWGNIFQGLLLVGFPALAIYGAKRSKILEALSPVVLCYGFGILLANLPGVTWERSASMTLAEASVPMAIPLLLFGTQFARWIRLAPTTLLSFALLIVSVVTVCTITGRYFSDILPEAWVAAGMLAGVYLGGTANMSAIGLALQVPERTFVLLNACDVVLGAGYFLFLVTVAQRCLHLIMPRFVFSKNQSAAMDEVSEFSASSPKKQARSILIALGLSAVAVGMGAGLASLPSTGFSVPLAILLITTLGIAGSFVVRIRKMPGTFETGEYLLLVFCVAIGSMANIQEVMNVGSTYLLISTIAMCGSILIHFLLAAALRIDADTVLITSTAGIFGPPFVGPIAAALKNREIIVSGFTTALVGIAIANYVGLGIAYFLKP